MSEHKHCKNCGTCCQACERCNHCGHCKNCGKYVAPLWPYPGIIWTTPWYLQPWWQNPITCGGAVGTGTFAGGTATIKAGTGINTVAGGLTGSSGITFTTPTLNTSH